MTALDLGCGMGYYSIAMAKMVGPSGRVVSVDLQRKMLEVMQKRAARKGVSDRIEPVRASHGDIRFRGEVDFALAMWMLHEVISKDQFFEQVRACLKEGARFLVAEPSFHVSRELFNAELKLAGECGFSMIDEPKVGVSYAAVLEKRSDG
jgi:ubiquinone/menaquinone biosynthesis C-methylase UbiE